MPNQANHFFFAKAKFVLALNKDLAVSLLASLLDFPENRELSGFRLQASLFAPLFSINRRTGVTRYFFIPRTGECSDFPLFPDNRKERLPDPPGLFHNSKKKTKVNEDSI
jgi:hypothetical protein